MKKKGFTLIELLVVIAIIAMLLAILMPAMSKVKKIAARVVCGTNLKGLGTAQNVYASDYNDEYTVQGRKPTTGAHTLDRRTADWYVEDKNWNNASTITVGASLYLLVREADVSPKSFVCPGSAQTTFDGKNDNNVDIVRLWDFGSYTVNNQGPENCVSYAYHQPYVGGTGSGNGAKGTHAATSNRSAAFAMMADQNPFYENPKLTRGGTINGQTFMDKVAALGAGAATDLNIDKDLQRWQIQVNNALPHDRDGQNVLYADGHNSYETRADVGVKNDNIWTRWSANTGATMIERRVGSSTTDVPWAGEDSLLVNDGERAATGS